VSEPADERYYALGQVVEMAAIMEVSLRMAFCALIGGKYAALVAREQETHWLIETCDVIARHHDELAPAQRDQLRTGLHACRAANRDRNRLVHEAWGKELGGAPTSITSTRRSYQIVGRAWTAQEIRTVADSIGQAQRSLLEAIEDALGQRSLVLAQRLLAEDAEEHGA
jgi:hypothetical protein